MPGLFCQRRNFVIFRSRHKDQLQIIAVNVHTAEQHSLLPEQFDEKGDAGLQLEFAGKKFHIILHNPKKQSSRDGQIRQAVCDDQIILETEPEYGVRLSKKVIETLDSGKCHRIDVVLSE